MRIYAVLLFLFIFAPSAELELSELRDLFYRSATDKDSAEQFSRLLSPVHTKSSPLLVCYKGVAEMMEAKYGYNPFSKFSRFKKGRSYIEHAIKQDPENPEMRFLRFSIQTNLPSILGYNDDIDKDKLFLLSKVNELTDVNLKQNVIGYLTGSKYCTAEELKKINK
ncbi:hypothetical protein [Pedobacter metabolipauper]|uniref:Tetratricopeptide repeat protein n=1 Tax=Pedobacter metabolipauper TaxID=425513 RepID=A0A4R6SZU1_9SPHI|nr:hypothetical protein [Pedobacter metabolipauper]TDQ11595.1 hypothetical protein ATK78_0718 [Pedobacter metabolipauper]